MPSALGAAQRLSRHQRTSNTDGQSTIRGFGNCVFRSLILCHCLQGTPTHLHRKVFTAQALSSAYWKPRYALSFQTASFSSVRGCPESYTSGLNVHHQYYRPVLSSLNGIWPQGPMEFQITVMIHTDWFTTFQVWLQGLQTDSNSSHHKAKLTQQRGTVGMQG